MPHFSCIWYSIWLNFVSLFTFDELISFVLQGFLIISHSLEDFVSYLFLSFFAVVFCDSKTVLERYFRVFFVGKLGIWS
ncbi:hypothetical protein Syun_009274 [Stephania yunnanensis]|uniref:Uncharacterized protein n=1 Tax=Stephania yunnanensis TaxID=152371 RepID=A0AAP0KF96_9MAGN